MNERWQMQACAQGNTVLREAFVPVAVERRSPPVRLRYIVPEMPNFT